MLAGPQAARGGLDLRLDIVDVLPTVFHLAGLAVPDGLDGRVVQEVLGAEARARPVVGWGGASTHEPDAEYPFSREEEAAIEESLRGLGYIE
jgi:hypothetical protein